MFLGERAKFLEEYFGYVFWGQNFKFQLIEILIY